jgi:flagellar basal body-associated protein FliL
MVKLIKLLKIVTVLSVTIGVLVVIGLLAKPIVIVPIYMTTSKNRNPQSQFDNYTTTITPSANTFYVQYKDLQGTGRQEAGETKPMYYSMDITVEASSRDTMMAVQANNAAVVNTIRETMSNIHGVDMNNEEGRRYIKQQIKRNLTEIYGEGIDDIYIEKFLYE